MAGRSKKAERESSSASALAWVRAEVAGALREVVPNEARLLQALEHVEALLADSRSELAGLMRELEGLVDRQPSRAAVIPIGYRDYSRRR